MSVATAAGDAAARGGAPAAVVACARALAAVAVLVAATIIPGCAGGGAQCVLVGFVRDGAPPEAALPDLRAAMMDAEQAIPAPAVTPGDPASAAAANAALKRRIDHVHAAMAARGYRLVEKLVPCDELPAGAPVQRR